MTLWIIFFSSKIRFWCCVDFFNIFQYDFSLNSHEEYYISGVTNYSYEEYASPSRVLLLISDYSCLGISLIRQICARNQVDIVQFFGIPCPRFDRFSSLFSMKLEFGTCFAVPGNRVTSRHLASLTWVNKVGTTQSSFWNRDRRPRSR